MATDLSIALAIGVVDPPEESGPGCGRLATHFEVGGDGVAFQQSVGRAAGFEARKHADTRHKSCSTLLSMTKKKNTIHSMGTHMKEMQTKIALKNYCFLAFFGTVIKVHLFFTLSFHCNEKYRLHAFLFSRIDFDLQQVQ